MSQRLLPFYQGIHLRLPPFHFPKKNLGIPSSFKARNYHCQGGAHKMGEAPCFMNATMDTPLELMGKRNALLQTTESIKKGREFTPRENDVFVTTYPKCGTTWVTQICHGLRTCGSIDFGEITEVFWWDILAMDCGQDLDSDQVASPRVFKSHEKFEDIARRKQPMKSCKYIHVARNPLDAFVSFYHFLPGFAGLEAGAISMEEFCDAIFAGVSHSGGIWDFYISWYKALSDPDVDVLWVFFEDLKSDLGTEVQRIAEFMNVEENAKSSDKQLHEYIDIATAQAEHSFMAKHKDKFDEHFVYEIRKSAMGLGHLDKPLVAKVRAEGGVVGSRKTIPDFVTNRLKDKWENIIEKKLGFKSYEELKKEVKRIQAQ